MTDRPVGAAEGTVDDDADDQHDDHHGDEGGGVGELARELELRPVPPSWGDASFLPLRPAASVISGLTTRRAPPDLAPEMMRTASPLDLVKALIVGLGPI
jgi:hypothetical protein